MLNLLKLLLNIYTYIYQLLTKGQFHRDKTLNLMMLLGVLYFLSKTRKIIISIFIPFSSNRNKHRIFGLLFTNLTNEHLLCQYLNSRDFNYSISFRIIKCIFYENVIAGFFEGSFSDFNVCTHKNTVDKNKSMAELKYRAEIKNKTNFSDSSLAACIHKA